MTKEKPSDSEQPELCDEHQPATMRVGTGVNMRLDVHLNTDNIAKLVVRKQLEQVKEMKADCEQRLAKARREHAEVTNDLTNAAEVLVEKQKVHGKATALAKALSAFTGKQFVVKFDNAVLNIEKKVVTFRCGVWDETDWERKQTNQHAYTSPDKHEDGVAKFTPEMRTSVKKIEKAAQRIEVLDRELCEINLSIADAPAARDRVSDMITEGLLKGTITENSAPAQVLAAASKARLRGLPAPKGS